MSPVADLPPALHVETSAVDLVRQGLANQLATAQKVWKDYTVKPGDTLYDLAIEHDTTVKALVKRNNIKGFIQPGQVIEIPGKAGKDSAKSSAKKSSSKGKASSSAGGTVTVRRVTRSPPCPRGMTCPSGRSCGPTTCPPR